MGECSEALWIKQWSDFIFWYHIGFLSFIIVHMSNLYPPRKPYSQYNTFTLILCFLMNLHFLTTCFFVCLFFCFRWWHVIGTWLHVWAGAQTTWNCETSWGKRERRPKISVWPTVSISPHDYGTKVWPQRSEWRWSCYGWPSPPVWSSSMLTCVKSVTWVTCFLYPKAMPLCRLAFKVSINQFISISRWTDIVFLVVHP